MSLKEIEQYSSILQPWLYHLHLRETYTGTR